MQQITMAQWAHDIRNALGTVALYVDTLRRPADPHTNDIVMSAHALLKKAAAMCNDAVSQVQYSERPERAACEVAEIARQVRDLVRPTLPTTVSMRVTGSGPVEALANAQDVFRILFNLAHNAATVARGPATCGTFASSYSGGAIRWLSSSRMTAPACRMRSRRGFSGPAIPAAAAAAWVCPSPASLPNATAGFWSSPSGRKARRSWSNCRCMVQPWSGPRPAIRGTKAFNQVSPE